MKDHVISPELKQFSGSKLTNISAVSKNAENKDGG